MRCFLTGATGFIGRQLVDTLLRQGCGITALVRQEYHGLPPEVTAVKTDLFDADRLRCAMRGCAIAFHLAALITFDQRQKPELMRVNAGGTASFLEAATQAGVRRAIIVSSACTLGISSRAEEIRDESFFASTQEEARNPYLASKIAAERLALTYGGRLEVVIANPTTVYGPGDRTLNSGSLFLRLARARIVPVPPGGSNAIDVADAAEGICAIARAGRPGERYVLAGENLYFSEIFRAIAGALGRSPLWLPLPRCLRLPAQWAAAGLAMMRRNRFFTPKIVTDLFAYKFYSSAKARNELGWQLRYKFAASVQRALDYYRRTGLIKV